MGLGRSISSALKRVLGSGPGAGAFVLSLLFGIDLLGASLDFMGFSDERATNIIVKRYGAHIAANQLEILAIYVAIGALFGASGAWLGRLWDWARMVNTTRWRSVVRGVVAALVGHGYFLVRNLVHYPQLYSESMYDRGGLRRSLMVALTEHLSVPLLDTLFILLLAGLIGGPLVYHRGRTRTRAWLAARPRLPWVGGAAVAGVLLLGLAVTRAPSRAHARGGTNHPNLLLIAVDSLRADRIFGPDAEKKFPTLAKLAQRGVRFREAHVTVPRTFPSFVTLLTGRFPLHHGIRHMFPTAAARRAIGPALPSALRDAGYRTAVVSDYAGEIFSRTPLGFDDIEVPYFDMKTIVEQRGIQVHPNVLPYVTSRLGRLLFPAVDALPERSDPSLLADRALARLEHLAGKPFFLTVFFSAAHFPYAAPAPYYRRFAQPGYDGPFRYQKPPLATAPVTPADAAQIRGLYDGAVAATDDAIARIIDRLERDGLADNTVIVLLADHGENLYDHDGRGMGHGDHLEGSSADHVPLVILDPTRPPLPHDVPGVVRDVDVVPTVAALLGVKPPAGVDGTDLGPLLRGERTSLELDAFTETEFWFTGNGPGFGPEERLPYPGITGATDLAEDGDIFIKPEWQDTIIVAKHRAIRSGQWKLVYRPTREGVEWRLYDLTADPEGLHEVGAAHADVRAALQRKLEAWMTSDGRTVMRGGFAVPK